MKNALRSVAMAFSMFSRLPMPRVEWRPENMHYMLAAYPLVGVAEGALLLLWAWACRALAFGTALFAAGMTLLPLALNGGVHLDGFADTLDALASHAPPQRRREILKDPHAGAFAVIGTAAYLLACFALCTELPRGGAALLPACLMGVAARALSALVSLLAPVRIGEGLLSAFRGAARRTASACIAAAFLLLALGGAALARPWSALAMAAALLVTALCVCRMSCRAFAGMSGDLAGFLMQTAQLSMLAAMIVTERLVDIV